MADGANGDEGEAIAASGCRRAAGNVGATTLATNYEGKTKSDTSSLEISGLNNQWGLTFSQRRAVTTEERSKEASADAGGFTVAAGVGLLDGACARSRGWVVGGLVGRRLDLWWADVAWLVTSWELGWARWWDGARWWEDWGTRWWDDSWWVGWRPWLRWWDGVWWVVWHRADRWADRWGGHARTVASWSIVALLLRDRSGVGEDSSGNECQDRGGLHFD